MSTSNFSVTWILFLDCLFDIRRQALQILCLLRTSMPLWSNWMLYASFLPLLNVFVNDRKRCIQCEIKMYTDQVYALDLFAEISFTLTWISKLQSSVNIEHGSRIVELGVEHSVIDHIIESTNRKYVSNWCLSIGIQVSESESESESEKRGKEK